MQKLTVRTRSRAEMLNVTAEVERAVADSGVREGTCVVYVPHTTAGVTLNENTDPAVRADILKQLDLIAPLDGDYAHAEGNSAAHIKASLVGSSATVPVEGGRLALGTWQGIYFCEFDGPRIRQAWVVCR